MRPFKATFSFTSGVPDRLVPGPQTAFLASSGFPSFALYPKTCSSLPPGSLTNPHTDSQASLSSACSITGPGFFSGRQGGKVGLSWALCPALSLQGLREGALEARTPDTGLSTPAPRLSCLSLILGPSPLLPQASQPCPRYIPHSSLRGLSYHLHHFGSLSSCGGADNDG